MSPERDDEWRDEMERRIENFKNDFDCKEFAERDQWRVVGEAPSKRKRTSVLDSCGVRLKSGDKIRFRCLVDECLEKLTVLQINGSSTVNGTTHLSQAHGIVATKTKSVKKNIERISKMIKSGMPGFMENPERWFQLVSSLL